MQWEGMWRVVSSPDFDGAYLRMEREPYVELRLARGSVDGGYHIGLQTGVIDGWLWGEDRVIFTFQGMDEEDETNGAGMATIEGDRLTFTLKYHLGDLYTFACDRAS